jgi:flagellar basal-body rod protein FlgF
MIKGIYTSEASMRPKMTRMEVIANNLANINSTGFKKDRVFVEMLNRSGAASSDSRDDLTGVTVRKAVDFTQGSLQPTGNTFDLAIEGNGFFAVETPKGMRLTRNGHFRLNADGSLVTAEGFAVQGENGAVVIPNMDKRQAANLTVNEAGEILADKEPLAQLRIVNVAAPDQLAKDHEALFTTTEGQLALTVPRDQIHVRQGFLEESNVEGLQEMIAMIELSRGFDTDQKIIQSQDATMDRSMDIGKV